MNKLTLMENTDAELVEYTEENGTAATEDLLEGYTVADLKTFCEDRNIVVGGGAKKDDIKASIMQYLAEVRDAYGDDESPVEGDISPDGVQTNEQASVDGPRISQYVGSTASRAEYIDEGNLLGAVREHEAVMLDIIRREGEYMMSLTREIDELRRTLAAQDALVKKLQKALKVRGVDDSVHGKIEDLSIT